MENNFIQMAASAGHAVAYKIILITILCGGGGNLLLHCANSVASLRIRKMSYNKYGSK